MVGALQVYVLVLVEEAVPFVLGVFHHLDHETEVSALSRARLEHDVPRDAKWSHVPASGALAAHWSFETKEGRELFIEHHTVQPEPAPPPRVGRRPKPRLT